MSHLHEDGDGREETHACMQKKRSGMTNRLISGPLTVDVVQSWISMLFQDLLHPFKNSEAPAGLTYGRMRNA